MSSDDLKKRVQSAVETYINRETPIEPKPTRHNNAPEKEVQDEVLKWLRDNGFSINVVESKAIYNRKSERYISQSVAPGFVDLVGNDKIGLGVFIELKAKGRRSTLRDNQRAFLQEKINTGCFAVVVDSVELLEKQYEHFVLLRYRQQIQQAKEFLLLALPVQKIKEDNEPLFDE